MAKPERLQPFGDLRLINDFCERFGQDPDRVFVETSFNTIMYFEYMDKERKEYRERFQYLYNKILETEKK